MFMNALNQNLPMDWTDMRYSNEDYQLIEIPSYTVQYNLLKSKVNKAFNLGIEKIVKVQNPFLYNQFLLKKEEYQHRNGAHILQLYHDTAACHVPSIVSGNLDWRLANRVKFGRGVSFSPDPSYANQESSRSNGTNRAMIIADVLVGGQEMVCHSKDLPATGYDTTVGNGSRVYVKYYDNEFYPNFIVYYTSKPHVYRRRRW